MATTQPGLRLLHTKLLIPRALPEIIERINLIRKFNEGLNTRHVPVTAPAGFGKTNLLSKYFEQSDRPVAWFTLDNRDNEQIVSGHISSRHYNHWTLRLERLLKRCSNHPFHP